MEVEVVMGETSIAGNAMCWGIIRLSPPTSLWSNLTFFSVTLREPTETGPATWKPYSDLDIENFYNPLQNLIKRFQPDIEKTQSRSRKVGCVGIRERWYEILGMKQWRS